MIFYLSKVDIMNKMESNLTENSQKERLEKIQNILKNEPMRVVAPVEFRFQYIKPLDQTETLQKL